MRQLAIAAGIALGIYAIAAGVGLTVFAADAVPTGATHNDCENFREELAPVLGVDEEDVPQSAIKAEAEECLAGHEREEEDVIQEYLFWSIWPAAICAAIFLAWPFWARILHNQERADEVAGEATPSH
jgi:hypothetical protein